MTFSSIVQKNFVHNLKKYISFYLVNSLIVAMLLMYGSLKYNPTVLSEIGKTTLYETINMSFMGILMFSIVFITYTNNVFLKHRGKEFGMYLTLGMTRKDLSKLILIENIGILLMSTVTGLVTGSLFSRLFYMGLNKVLNGSRVEYILTHESFTLSIGVFVSVFLCNFIFNLVYIRKISIIDAIKSSKKKEVGKDRVILGAISLVLFVVALYCLPKTMFGEILKGKSYFIGVFVFLTITCPYMIIGSFIGVIKCILSKFPKIYNKNILVFSNLSHRFLAYKNILYMLCVLLAGALFFVGYTYANYASTEDYIKMNNPYEILFLENNLYNKISEEEVSGILEENNATIKSYSALEFLKLPLFYVENHEVSLRAHEFMVVSESNYNNHMDTNLNLEDGEGSYVSLELENLRVEKPGMELPMVDEVTLNKLLESVYEDETGWYSGSVEMEKFKELLGDGICISLSENKIEERHEEFSNFRIAGGLPIYNAIVISDKRYEEIERNAKENHIHKLHLINAENADEGFYALLDYMREKNGLGDEYWKYGNLFGFHTNDESGIIESFRPVYNGELITLHLESNGIMFFSMFFIGIMFVLANGVVLYYKILNDIEEEKERVVSLMRIGITSRELKSTISKELAITFFIPIILGGGLSFYYIYIMVVNSLMVELILRRAMVIFIGLIVVQTIFYYISRRKYINEVM